MIALFPTASLSHVSFFHYFSQGSSRISSAIQPASEIQIRAWRSFGIGDGKVIDVSQVKHELKNLVPLLVDESASHENIEWKQDSPPKGIVALFVGNVMAAYS